MSRGRALLQLSSCLHGHVPEHADWQSILSLANEHLVTPALHDNLKIGTSDAAPVPDEVQSFLVEVYRRGRARNASLGSTLHEVLRELNAVDIVPMLLKGCALMEGAKHDSPAGRILCDLDLMVRPDELQAALDALSQSGFNVVEDHRNRNDHPVIEIARPIDAGSIDLHQLAPGSRGSLTSQLIDGHNSLVEIAGQRALRPSPELQIFMLVLHDQLLDGRFWRGGLHLRHLVDIAELTRRGSEIRWQELLDLCPGRLVRSALRVQLLAARRVAGAQVPDWIVDGFWTKLHWRRQRFFFLWPELGIVLRSIGLNARMWRILSRIIVGREREAASSTKIALQDAQVLGLSSAECCRLQAKDIR